MFLNTHLVSKISQNILKRNTGSRNLIENKKSLHKITLGIFRFQYYIAKYNSDKKLSEIFQIILFFLFLKKFV